jgi:hypothetical protein
MYLGEDNTKLIITSPRIVGFQAAVSWMPDYSETFDGFGSRSSDDPGQQSEMLELAANYIGSLGDLDLSAYGAYQVASIESPNFAGEDDLDTWGAGANVKYEGLTVGGSFLSTNAFANRLQIEDSTFFNVEGAGVLGNGGVGVDDDFQTTVWGAGATYAYDAFIFGVNYVDGSAERPGLPNVESRAWEVAAAYRLFNLARLTIGYQKWEFGQTGLDSSSAIGLQQDFEANVIYTELSFDIEDVSTLTEYFD